MAIFCRWWRMTPEEYRRLRWDEYQAMTKLMRDVAEQERKQRHSRR